ncbi:MAG: winged helix-turn-helix transcriptional regulator [Chloroflexi bacterium]|nr:winged helix-turn-helix transcriptional regulator [Chloroflexota bacterium]
MYAGQQLEDSERAAIYRLHAEFCKTLSDANRLLIINELGKGEVSVGELARRLGLGQSNVSKHLALLREHGLATVRRVGPTIYYSLSDPRISEAIRLLREVQADQLERRRVLYSHG